MAFSLDRKAHRFVMAAFFGEGRCIPEAVNCRVDAAAAGSPVFVGRIYQRLFTRNRAAAYSD
jgi:hypothetical protein